MHYSLSNRWNERSNLERRREMTRYWKYSAMVLLALAIFVPVASARPVSSLAGTLAPGSTDRRIMVGMARPMSAPYGEVPGPFVGKVKFDTKMKDAGVFVDGGYAGTVRQLGTFPLRPGDSQHRASQSRPARRFFRSTLMCSPARRSSSLPEWRGLICQRRTKAGSAERSGLRTSGEDATIGPPG